MSKIFKSMLSLFLAVFMVATLAAVPSSAATLNYTSVTVTKGYQTTLSVSGASGTVTWSTGDKSIATVSSKGKVVGKAPGTTYIYAKTGSTTLKCKVKVVASKITANKSSVTLDKVGDTATVVFTVKGSRSGMKVGSTKNSVASGSWLTGKWDGDKVSVKITAKGAGTAKIKVYNSNYPSTCYKYVTVTVKEQAAAVQSNAILPYDQSVKVTAGDTASLSVYAQNQSNLLYSVTNSNVATVTAGTLNNNIRTYNIKGVNAGTTTVRFYDRYDSKSYVDVTVTVEAANVKYYELYDKAPTVKLLATDQILTIKPTTTTTYYMLVPANYDIAYVNTLTAQKFNNYGYYTVYTVVPNKKANNDTYKQFTHTNSNYTYGTRYVLLPANYDEVEYNTTVAKYNNKFDYWTIYSEKPTLQNSWDYTETWQVTDAQTGKVVTRYMVVPYNSYDQTKINEIKQKDQEANQTYKEFTIYTTQPSVNNTTEEVIWFMSGGSWKFMIVPKNADVTDYVKANDIILKDTGVYEYNVAYSTPPTTQADDERLITGRIGSGNIYVLYKPNTTTPVADQDSAARDAAMRTYATGRK
ncbi:MAG: Ig-like domain-containing protein [Ruminococcus sp.]|nr:Ig-like domain-containing protein [Ruminococcus sp.]MCM1381345.1 Ig-like domain-containing protein [Muribaculaceae bacterium]MCM1480545.1 Ig-like domain-containing protein [Muribaculaceae bacterium]